MKIRMSGTQPLVYLQNSIVAIVCFGLFSEATLATPNLYHSSGRLPEQVLPVDIRLSPRCRHDVFVYLDHLQGGSDWALKMFDSTGKLESGIMTGARSFLGFYRECLEALPQVMVPPATEDYSKHSPAFTSMYCLSSLNLDSEQNTRVQSVVSSVCKKLAGASITTGVCVPSTCTAEDVSALATFVLCEWGCNGNATATRCRTGNLGLFQDVAALAVTSLFVLLALILIVATVVDFSGRQHGKEQPSYSVTDGKKSMSATVTTVKEVQGHQKISHKALLCFSLLQNGYKLFGSESSKAGSVAVLNGLRFFSIAWVVCMHNRRIVRYVNIFQNPDDLTERNLVTRVIDRGTLAVDTCLFIGGFLVGYVNLKKLRENSGKKNWLLFHVHRYFRTMPLTMATVAVCAFLMHHFGDGPLWMDIIGPYESSCRDNWWTVLFNLQNFVHFDNACLSHTWYLAVDFQFHLTSPILLYLLYWWPRVGGALGGLLVVVSTVIGSVYTAVHGVGSVPGVYDYVQDVYIKPYFRIPSYLTGILLGHYIVLNSKDITLEKLFVLASTRRRFEEAKSFMKFLTVPEAFRTRYGRLGWFCCVFCLMFAVFGLRIINPAVESPWRGAFHAAAPTVWCFGIAWIVYASMAGCGGFVTKFFSCRIFSQLSKLVFAVYIAHQPLQYVFYASRQESFHYNHFLMGYFFVGNLVLAFPVAAVLCLLIEIPMSRLENLALGRE